MKLQIVSDLHIEFQTDGTEFSLPKTDADVIVIAGDVGVGFEEEFEFCKQTIQTHNKPVIFVLGNHSFYGKDADVNDIRKLWSVVNYPNLHYLDEERFEIINGVLFLGGILWTDFSIDPTDADVTACDYAMQRAGVMMNDYRGTLIGNETWTPQKSVEEHWKTRRAMINILNLHSELKTVVVSHHLPSYKGIDSSYRDSELNPAYASHLDNFIKYWSIDLWCHGHVHVSKDYEVEGARVVCNPRGYYNYEENAHFNPAYVVEV
jgi:Icc-related predicted phosphoesterase